ncbi:serine/threonine protein kinase [Pseudenhygromyxa sp. WMMC2535]|uniref:protein kinase domain-containing protein n=1 Tax=Pseudenhygromyxa sp. WMMC2535 TaxID=2712867 RepID=UPI0015954D64|nr:serine/threonine protein kinase [Pseudenhygromyxa sp. WMMC2535]
MHQLGQYALVRKIASGGMAEVWMARRRAMGGASKAVAIKLLASHLAEKAVYRRMFVDEARLTMMLTHSNIVQVFDVGEQAGRSYLVMEWVDGMDLSRLAGALRKVGEPMPFDIVAHVVGEVLRGLSYAHGLHEGETSSTIVHRDISPHNVLVSVSGEVKISDFGVARLASEETSGLHVRGKLRYMPPEQLRGDSRAPTIDLFAVGAMMHELLEGERFRASLERDALFAMVLAGEVPPLTRPKLPPELRALCEGLLMGDRHARIHSAEQALAMLRRWSGYRNAADDLAGLVRRFVGVVAPRTGLTMAISEEDLALCEVQGDDPTAREGEHRGEGSSAETCYVDDEGNSTLKLRAMLSTGSGRRASRLSLGLFSTLAVLGVGAGFAFSWASGRGDVLGPSGGELLEHALHAGDHGHEHGHDHDHDDGEPAPQVEPALSVAVGAAALGRGAEEGGQGEGEEAPAPESSEPESSEPEPEPQPRAKRGSSSAKQDAARPLVAKQPAEVEFAAHEFFFVWIKVDGRSYALEPLAKVSLPPGRHQVWLREGKDQPWQSAGKIRVQPGERYKVVLRRPAKLSITTRT